MKKVLNVLVVVGMLAMAFGAIAEEGDKGNTGGTPAECKAVTDVVCGGEGQEKCDPVVTPKPACDGEGQPKCGTPAGTIEAGG